MLKVEISGEAKEIADLVVALRDRQADESSTNVELDIANGNPNDLVVKNREHWKIELSRA
jgi:hypothetical protein